MFKKVLIANRGAIATRIIRTLRKMGVTSVAVYAEVDAQSLHVRQADEAYSLGEGGAADTYLNSEKVLEIARACGAEAIHPGYGFLSENSAFVTDCEAADIAFIGPTPEQMQSFGLKHRAREIAANADVPLPPGSGLLANIESACQTAADIGYPVMLKSTAGGGGIGMQVCESESVLREAFNKVKQLGKNNFADDGVFLEKYIARARHIEVQAFGDGKGGVLAIGERDCSAQRRNQKVIEECPAPNLPEPVRQRLYRLAETLLSSVRYRNAATVEYIYDADTEQCYFLEVNTRLQVEHGVTEMVWSVDLVQWMLQQAAGELPPLEQLREGLTPSGHAIQLRVYAEDPYRDFQPCAGLLSHVELPTPSDKLPGLRIEHWLDSGIEVSPFFDPMLAKIIYCGDDRAEAIQGLRSTLDKTQLYGIESNCAYLRHLLDDSVITRGEVTTRYLASVDWCPARIDILQGGTQTTIQDYPARGGYWDVGVPPSGPFDNYSFRLANALLGNLPDAAALEITLQGPTLQFSTATRILVTGAEIPLTLDGEAVAMSTPVDVAAGQTLVMGRIERGARAYLAVAGGIDCPTYLGSRSTFTLGQFGGHNGRALRTGDVLALGQMIGEPTAQQAPLADIGSSWELRVIYGPHGAPDFFTDADVQTFFSEHWEVHYNSSRTGVRLIGPKPEWARQSGGEAGMHPSNIHDNAYAFGTVDFTGDMPVILGPDGPSLGGFVCPATVITADLWKLGQLRAGDTLRFVPVSYADAVVAEQQQQALFVDNSAQVATTDPAPIDLNELPSPIVQRLSAAEVGDEVVYRLAGDHFLLVEYGPLELDIRLRFRAHALMQDLQKNPLPGLRELTPGIRSLQLHYDSQQLPLDKLLAELAERERHLSQRLDSLTVPSRTVWLPLSWNDEACQLAVDKYQQSVRANAPWCPDNLEFIRRINGLDSIDDVKRIVFDAAYLVMGLGDVYLGAPVATPVDPRHRLVTTKYNPARTWTAENSVGIGGSYLCVYGMEGPGGYQFVGRTMQMWNRYRRTEAFTEPYLLRFFDQIRFYEVGHDELSQIRRDFPLGDYPLRTEPGEFSLAGYQAHIEQHSAEIEAHTQRREQAFSDELARWHADGQFHYEAPEVVLNDDSLVIGDDDIVVDSSVAGSVWQLNVAQGDQVEAGQCVMLLESMKMEVAVVATQPGTVKTVVVKEGGRVSAGQPLLILDGGLES
ncbi:urea carboxylase [Gilvimarinus sp. 1_MG-2023]|uniref:urea carboxylase n=1 Tax=Gilvimarinus sp. 1_MG-2023 TaxID=3062638 RepID=UPI0026E12866|nr:urea carboxylase [Gilvimarinus sp. 1_MG-2023]MDO6746440.1 urea carboxylase [Gilvimarinus sp. 1_MG-2023]